MDTEELLDDLSETGTKSEYIRRRILSFQYWGLKHTIARITVWLHRYRYR